MSTSPKVLSLVGPLSVSADDHAWQLEAAGFWKYIRDEKIAWLKRRHGIDCSEMTDSEIDRSVRQMLVTLRPQIEGPSRGF